MKELSSDIGVIIGRFQIHELHEEHIKLIDHVLHNHNKVILFLGTTEAVGTRRNPLDFITRKLMIEEVYGTALSSILPLPDKKEDVVWSVNVDKKIREVFPNGSVTIYGSKDSFIPYYKGKFSTKKLEPENFISASFIREKISKEVKASKEFRMGVIYAIYGLYPTTYSTVDIAIIDGKGNLLLGKKPDESSWRFIGGFIDPTDQSEIQTCRREGMEETGLELGEFKFITSMKVNDWRYKNISDRGIMTHFYEAKVIFGSPQPNDDIAVLKWFDISKIDVETFNIVEGHQKLLKEYFEWKKDSGK